MRARKLPRCWTTLLALLLAMVAGLIQAQPLRLTDLPTGSLGNWASVLVEDGSPLTLEEAQARQREGRFRKENRAVLTYGIGSHPRWVHLELFNPTTEQLPFRLATGTTWTDRLDLFIVHDNRVSASWRTGDDFPNAPGLTPGVGFTLATSFAPGRSDLYLRVESIDPLVLPIELMTEEQARSGERLVHYSYGFVYGFLLALLAYNGMLFAGMRKRSHLYYSLYLVSLILLNAAYTGHGSAWLWPDQPQLQRYVILVLMVLYGCCGLLFAGRFLDLAVHAPRVLRMVRLSVISVSILMALCIVAGSQLGAALVAFSFAALFTLGMVLLGILTIHHGCKEGRYFLAAALFGMLGAAFTTFSVWGWLPFNALTYHGLEYGVIIEAALLALALAHHFNEVTAKLSRITVSRDVLSAEVAERKRIETELRIAAAAFESQEGMVITDANSVILRVNRAFTETTGYTAEDVVGQTPRLFKSGRHNADFYAEMWESIGRTGSWQGEIWDQRKDGEIYPKWLTITAVKSDDGTVTHYVGAHTDISSRKVAEDAIKRMAFYDQLTQLPNRRLLNDRMKQAMAASVRSGCYGALMFLDLDNFKPLNDAYGHVVGDLLLIEAAHRLNGCVREMDTVARFGGDEFVVMLSELHADRDESISQARVVAEKIRSALSEPYWLTFGHEGVKEVTVEHYCTASIGLVMFLGHEGSQNDILKWADAAMYLAKKAGRNSIRIYDGNA